MGQDAQSIQVLLVEDVELDAELALLQLKRAGIRHTARRVERETELRQALREAPPHIILSDFSLPQFDGLAALEISRELAPGIPFIFVSAAIGEDRAVTALQHGAVDYLLKGNLGRLPSAVNRALGDAQARKERGIEQARLARLDRLLRMLSGINALMVRVRDRKELLSETCRLSVAAGGYATAHVYLKWPGTSGLQALGASGTDPKITDCLRDAMLLSGEDSVSILDRVAKRGRELICSNTSTLDAAAGLKQLLAEAGLLSLIALPIVLDNGPIGALVLTMRQAGAVSKEELQVLREISGNLSFALQFLRKDTTVRFLSHFDSITGLANRSLFCDRLARLFQQPSPTHSRYLVAVVDIERLSVINDSFSRRIGDRLLQQVSDRLKRRFPQTECIAHFGGGTFAIVVEAGKRTPEEVDPLAREHHAALFGTPFVIEDREIPVVVRSGLAVYPDHSQEAAALVQNAEAALHSARTSGGRQTHYNEQQQVATLKRLSLEHKLRLALEREQFELHYQPKVNVMSRHIEGAEALIRWRDPEAGLVSPAAFLPVLESSGLILDVGNWVIKRAALDCQQWLRAGAEPVRIAVNIAAAQVCQPDFVETFLSALRGWSTPRAGLDIEITEGILQEELASEVTKLKLLREAGVRIAIDDFGTGYSSLGRLATLPIDTLKIDRTFIDGVPKDYTGRMLVKTIIALARAFRLTTVAEGVENQDQLDFLWQVGCDQSQGYLHSKALPGDEFRILLEQGRGQLVRPPAAVLT
jgi:diguanylate cyclase (GGDEF)-like protein